MSRSTQSQPNLENHTQQSQNYTQQSVTVTHSLPVSNNTVRQVASSDAAVIPNQYIIVLKSDAHPHTSSIVDKVKNSVAEKIMKTVANKLRKLDASIIFTNNFAFGGFSAKIPDHATLDILKQDPNVAFIEQDKLVHINSQILPTGIKRIGADHSSAVSGNGVGNDVDADIAILD